MITVADRDKRAANTGSAKKPKKTHIQYRYANKKKHAHSHTKQLQKNAGNKKCRKRPNAAKTGMTQTQKKHINAEMYKHKEKNAAIIATKVKQTLKSIKQMQKKHINSKKRWQERNDASSRH